MYSPTMQCTRKWRSCSVLYHLAVPFQFQNYSIRLIWSKKVEHTLWILLTFISDLGIVKVTASIWWPVMDIKHFAYLKVNRRNGQGSKSCRLQFECRISSLAIGLKASRDIQGSTHTPIHPHTYKFMHWTRILTWLYLLWSSDAHMLPHTALH